MEEFDDDADIELNKPLDARFVALGLVMMIFGLATFVFTESRWTKYFGLLCFVASFFIMAKKAKENRSK